MHKEISILLVAAVVAVVAAALATRSIAVVATDCIVMGPIEAEESEEGAGEGVGFADREGVSDEGHDGLERGSEGSGCWEFR